MLSALPLLAILPDMGGGEILVVLFLVLLLFGGEKMPQLAKGMGKAIREFRKAASDVEREFKQALDEVPDTNPPKPAPLVKPASPATPPVSRTSTTPPPTP